MVWLCCIIVAANRVAPIAAYKFFVKQRLTAAANFRRIRAIIEPAALPLPGFSCPAGSTSANMSACIAGQYSDSGAASCTLCTVGYACNCSQGCTSATSGGLCTQGQYGTTAGGCTACPYVLPVHDCDVADNLTLQACHWQCRCAPCFPRTRRRAVAPPAVAGVTETNPENCLPIAPDRATPDIIVS